MSKQPSGMILGQKGVQYGLQKVLPKKPGLAGQQAAQRKAATANVFGDDSDEEDVERQIARQADKKRAAAKVQQMYEDALAEDPSAFDYDGVYDSIQEARVAPKQQDKVQRQSKYIGSLLEQAQQRKREQDVLYERRMVRERQQEDHLYEDKERFVTNAYRRKLEEDKKWLEAERQRELEDERNDVRKVGHLGNFYANLLTKNVAYGNTKPEDSKPDASRQAAAGREAPAADDGAAGGAGAGAASAGAPSLSREGSPAAGPPGGGGADKAVPGVAGPSAKVLSQLDRYDILRLEAERALRQRKPEGQREGAEAGGAGGRPRSASPHDEAAGPLSGHEDRRTRRGEGKGEEGPAQAEGVATAAEAAAAAAQAGGGGAQVAAASAVAAKRRNDEGAVQSARERYLARKQQKTG